ncbi:Non-hem dioxygenase N-terminal domain [Dillenia turbinata]|uniref:Non-hem dioxygenase N-terminal domain n=1 Tax=Dillenia turbinata TaxID=194707 RepID=A0AAN8UYL1_9MAGN
MVNPIDNNQEYDRAKEVKEFDDSKIGVKGLIDSGINSIPKFFIHPPETLADFKSNLSTVTIPVIDLSSPTIVDEIRTAAKTFGFFQIINHGIEISLLDKTLSAIKSFNELETEEKKKYYRRDGGNGFTFSTNVDLFVSKAASWRDTVQIRLGPVPVEPERIPEVMRSEVVEINGEIKRLGEKLMGLLAEGLGVGAERFNEMSCVEGRLMVGHYYPYCPQADLTVGINSHTDPGVLTVLMENEVGGLQIKHGDGWVDVKPIRGGLVINVGDILQILSNDEYKSVEHRVLANSYQEPRLSAAVFFNVECASIT